MTPILVHELNLRGTFEKYEVLNIVGKGGWGLVYKAIRKSDNKIVSLKFFGYTEKNPEINAINSEVMLMMSLIGVDGVVQMESLFYDTPKGFVDGKKKLYCQSYPVIVMEMLSGGELIHKVHERVQNHQKISESEISRLFKGVIEALDSLHRRNYIHRDLKLQNLLFVSDSDDSPIKIIDFGCMIQLPENKTGISKRELVGSPGSFAPETLTKYEYSYKTDIWQAGCILYTLLCGHPPFYAKEEYQPLIIHGRFCESSQWTSLSNEAQDLIKSMLCVIPDNRITISAILSHTWMTGGASIDQLDKDYARRVQSLSLREKLRHIFSKDVFRQNLLLTKENSYKIENEEKEEKEEENDNKNLSTQQEDEHFEHDLSKLPPIRKSFHYHPLPPLPPTEPSISSLSSLSTQSSNTNSIQSENYHKSKRWFERLDTNRDGVLSEKELVEGIVAILSEDDNYLPQTYHHNHHHNHQLNDESTISSFQSKSNQNNNQNNQNNNENTSSSSSTTTITTTTTTTTANFIETDIRPSTCPSMTACVQELFSVIDHNSNGSITFAEFTHFFDLTMHCTIMNRVLEDEISETFELNQNNIQVQESSQNELTTFYEGNNSRKRKSTTDLEDV